MNLRLDVLLALNFGKWQIYIIYILYIYIVNRALKFETMLSRQIFGFHIRNMDYTVLTDSVH
jgi:hypothetical protein